MRSLLLGLLLLGVSVGAKAQATLEDGYRAMYNLQFEEAHRIFGAWQRSHPNDPFAAVSDAAAYLFTEFNRLHILEIEFFLDDREWRQAPGDPKLKAKFEEALTKGERLADAALARSAINKDALFAKAMAQGLRSDYLGLVEGRYLASLKAMKAGRIHAEKLIEIDPQYGDAYLAIGIENYILSQKPMPVRWLLRAYGSETDAARGIENVQLCIKHGLYMKPFARLMLAVAAVRDKDYGQARELLRGLAREFPRNSLYAEQANRLPK
jgi:tetratricopeptide (TPR) repeat protein